MEPLEPAFSITPLLTILVSTLGSILIIITGERRANLREFWSVAAGVLQFALVSSMMPAVLAGQAPQVSALPAPSRDRARLSSGRLRSCSLSGVASLVAASFYSIGYMRSLEEHAQTRYFTCFALALSATMGVAFSANLFTLFLFYEGLTLATYPLVAHKETAEAKAGARKYVIYLLGAAKVMLIPAIILTYNIAGTLEFRAGGIFRSDHASHALHASSSLPRLREECRDAVPQLASRGDGRR
jgi:multicomponent Na+:H+ antiporter subunit D